MKVFFDSVNGIVEKVLKINNAFFKNILFKKKRRHVMNEDSLIGV